MIMDRSYQKLPRCPLPVIFLDTHVISNMAKWKAGKKLDKLTEDRGKTLYERIHYLVRAKKIICPEIPTWQEEYRLDTRIREICEKVVVKLSKGISFRYPLAIEDSQIQLAMKAYVDGVDSVDYSKQWLLMYYRDPIKQLLDDLPFVVRFSGAEKLESNGQVRERKKRLKDKLADIKKADAERTPTFDEKLQEEYVGYVRGIVGLGFKLVDKYLKAEDVTIADTMNSLGFGMRLAFWARAGGKPGDTEGLMRFYASDHLKSVPNVEISAKLWAGFAVHLKGAKPKGSDSTDIRMIAAVLPYADLLILDKTMTDLTRDRLMLHEKYGAKIFSFADFEALCAELDRIDKGESPLREFFGG